MSDDLSKKGPADAARINIHERHEVVYWTKKLGCSEDVLKDAVARVGVISKDVEEHLAGRANPG